MSIHYKVFIKIKLLLIVSIISLQAKQMDIGIKNYTKSDYKADYQNWSVSVGPDNFIYVANNSGLLVYDGVSWDFFTNPVINNIRAVKIDSLSGRIYTAGYREMGYWQWDSLGMLHYTSLNNLVESAYTKNEEFWNIVITSDGVVFQSFSGLFIYSNGIMNLIRPYEFINSITLIDGDLYVLIGNKGIYKVKDGEIVPYLTNNLLKNKTLSFLLPVGRDSVLIGTSGHGVFLYDGNVVKPTFESKKEFFTTNNINRATIINDEIIIIGTILNGIIGINLKGETLFELNEESGLQNNTVLGLHSMDNACWVALDRGISFIKFNTDPSYKTHIVKEIGASYSAAANKGNFYLGTNQGLYYRKQNETNQEFRLIPGTQGQVWDCSVYDGQLFVGHNSGTFTIDNSRINKISNANGGFDIINNPFQFNTLIQSTYLNLIFYRKLNGAWKESHRIANFFDLIRYIELDHLNNLWASHMRRGIYKLKLNDSQDSVLNTTYFGKNSVFGKEYDLHVFKLENQIVFTTGDKLFTYDDINSTIVPYDRVNEKLGKYAGSHRIINAGNHHYWFITPDDVGLFFFELNKISLVKEYPLELFGRRVIAGYENVVPLTSRKAILCLENGYAMLYADSVDRRNRIKNAGIIPRKIIMSSRNGNEEVLPLDMHTIKLPYRKNNLRIQYAFPHYSMTNVKYKYIMEGLSDLWFDPLTEPLVELERIPAGSYTLKVVAFNAWNEKSGVYETYIKVSPPWYNSIPAWIVYVILFISLIISVRYFSVRKTKEREKKKRELKEQELIKLRNQNLRNELSYKSRELAGSTMAIIRKHEFLMKLKEMLKRQKQELGTRYPDKYYNQIIEKIDKNISGSDDWKIFETNIEQAHEQFIQKLVHTYPHLSHSDLRLCTFLRMNLSSKEIAPLMHISVRGVENHRYRIRKKLGLASDENLTDFILAFEV